MCNEEIHRGLLHERMCIPEKYICKAWFGIGEAVIGWRERRSNQIYFPATHGQVVTKIRLAPVSQRLGNSSASTGPESPVTSGCCSLAGSIGVLQGTFNTGLHSMESM